MTDLNRGPEGWTHVVRNECVLILGYDSTDEVDPDLAFTDLGFNSLAAVELSARLSAATGIELPLTLGFDYPTPRALGRYIAARLGEVAVDDESAEDATNHPIAALDDDPVVI